MRRILLLLAFLPFMASAQTLTKSQVDAKINQLITGSPRPVDFRNVMKYMSQYSRQADSTALVQTPLAKAYSDSAYVSSLSALASKQSAAISEANASNSATAASVNSNVYATEVAGRAAVANGQYFLVAGSGDAAAYLHRRIDASTVTTPTTTYPSLQAAQSGVTALAKTVAIDNGLDDLTKNTTGRLLRNLPVPMTYTRNLSTGVATTQGNMVQAENADRSVVITGFTDVTTGSIVTDMQTGISSTGITKIQYDFVPSASVTLDPMVGIGYVAGAERIIYLWRPTGLVSYTKTNTSTFSQLIAAGSPRDYVNGDILRMELVFSGSTVTLNLYKTSARTLVATTTTVPSTLLPTGDFIIGARGAMTHTFSLTTEQAGGISTTLTSANAYTDSKVAIVQNDVTAISVASANVLPTTFQSGSYYRNSDGAITANANWTRSSALVTVSPSTQYTITGVSSDAFGSEFKADGSFNKAISTATSGVHATAYTFTTDALTRSVGLNISSNGVNNQGTAMLALGSDQSKPYEIYGDKYLKASKIKGTLPVETEVAAIRRNSVNLLEGGFTSGFIYRNSDGAIGSSGTQAQRTTNLISVLPNTEYTIVNANSTFLGNEYSTAPANTANRVQVIAPALTGSVYTTYTFTTSNTTKYLGLNVVLNGGADNSSKVLLIQGKTLPGSFEVAGQKYTDGANIRGQIPGNDLPNIYYQFDLTGFNDTETGSIQGTGLFTIYCRYATDSPFYVGYRIGRVLNTTIRADLWRIVGAELYKWDGSAMVSQITPILNSSETEFVWSEAGKTDFTGGYHGDELMTEIYFYVNGIRLTDLSASIPVTGAREFWYIQKSDMIETDNATIVKQCTHHKNTRFTLAGYTTKNRVIWSRPITIGSYFGGLITVAHSQSGIIYDENYVYANTTAPATAVELLKGVGTPNGLHEINYLNTTTGLGAVVTSRMTKALNGTTDNTSLYDSQSDAYVRDITTYAKYYRGLSSKTTSVGEIWESETSFKTYKK